MRIALVAGVILAAGPAARAGGKPTAAEAKKAAQAWMAAMTADDPESTAAQAKALTAMPFFSAATGDADDNRCLDSTVSDATALDKRLECIRGNLSPDGNYRPLTSKLEKAEPFIGAYRKQLDKLDKTATLVVLDEDCQGVYNLVLFATVKDAGAVKVSAVLASHGECGE